MDDTSATQSIAPSYPPIASASPLDPNLKPKSNSHNLNKWLCLLIFTIFPIAIGISGYKVLHKSSIIDYSTIPILPVPPPRTNYSTWSRNPYMLDTVSRDTYKHSYSAININKEVLSTEARTLNIYAESLESHVIRIIVGSSNVANEISAFVKSEEPDEWVNSFQHDSLSALLKVNENQEMPFNYQINDTDGNIIVDTFNRTLQFHQNYLEFELIIPSDYICGLGDGMYPLKLTDGTYQLIIKGGELNGKDKQSHGSGIAINPFLMVRLANGKFMGISFNNLNPMNITIDSKSNFLRNDRTLVTFVTNGGKIDLYYIIGMEPYALIAKYIHYMGLPLAVPLWSLGTQLNEDFRSVYDVEDAISLMKHKNFSIDSIWLGRNLLFMDCDFKVNDINFPRFLEYSMLLKKKGIKVGVTVGSGLCASYGNMRYLEAKYHGLFLVDHLLKNDYENKCRAQKYSYLDFINPSTSEFWKNALETFYTQTAFDAIQLSHQEMYNTQYKGNYFNGSIPEYIYHPTNLNYKLLVYKEEYMHNYFPILQIESTHEFSSNKLPLRTLLISDAFVPRIGCKAGKYIDNVPDSWEGFKTILPIIYRYQMLGAPYMGFKILTSDQDLLQRSFMLATMMPMFRIDSTTLKQIDETTYSANMAQRNSLTLYYYSLLMIASLYGYPVVNPLFFESSKEGFNKAASASETEMLIGRSLLLCPVLSKGLKGSMQVYFPNENWYKLDGSMVNKYVNGSEGNYAYIEVNNVQPVFVKGGSIVFTQNAKNISSTNDLLNIVGEISVAPNYDNRAEGYLISDSLIIPRPRWWSDYRLYSFVYHNGVFKIAVENIDTQYDTHYEYEKLGKIRVFNYNCELPKYSCAIGKNIQISSVQANIIKINNQCVLELTSNIALYLSDLESIVFGDTNQFMQICTANKYEVNNIETFNQFTQFDINNQLHFNATAINSHYCQIKIHPFQKYWDPQSILNYNTRSTKTASLQQFGLVTNIINQTNFFFNLQDKNQGIHLQYIPNSPLIISSNLTVIELHFNATNLYGLGERIHGFELTEGLYTLYARDIPNPIEDSKPPGKNLYGSHPFILYKLPSKQFGGFFMLSSNPMDINIQKDQNGFLLKFIINGGIINMFTFALGNPIDVIKSYHALIGTPPLLPFWAFGYHQCRFGYNSESELKYVVDNFNSHNLPLDVLWTDIDYMDKHRDFTVDKNRYPHLGSFVKDLKNQSIMFVPIIDGGIGISNDYKEYAEGLKNNIYIMSPHTQQPYAGVVWPGFSVYIDFMHPKAEELWNAWLTDLNKKFDFDGIWLDMNEVSNFCQGDCSVNDQFYLPLSISRPFEDLPYTVGHRTLYEKSIAPDAYHYGDAELNIELNMHNIYGHMMIVATNNYLTNIKKSRPFIIARGTFPGSGKYGSHWLGDNFSNWDFLRYSIPGIFNFQMFGIPFSGSDVCGFMENTETELCQRWIQLGAFYPFFRNHNTLGMRSQEPYTDSRLEKVFANSMYVRYALIRYMYSAYYQLTLKVHF